MAAALLLLLVPPVGLLAALAFLARPRAARVPLKGRHVLITGGSSGIGLAMATAAAREGARVSILARNLARLEEARAAIQRESGRGDVGVHAADVRDADAVARALREAGPVDVLVCNHGVFVPQELERQDMEEIKWMVDINLMGTFHLIKAALPAMKARTRETRLPGSIAIMSSQAGQVDDSLLRCFAPHAAKLFDVMLLAGKTNPFVGKHLRCRLVSMGTPRTQRASLRFGDWGRRCSMRSLRTIFMSR